MRSELISLDIQQDEAKDAAKLSITLRNPTVNANAITTYKIRVLCLPSINQKYQFFFTFDENVDTSVFTALNISSTTLEKYCECSFGNNDIS